MKRMKIGLLATMLIAVCSAFATKAEDLAIVFYEKNTITGDCLPSNCNLSPGTTCNAPNTIYYVAQDTDPNKCVTPAQLRRQP